MNSLTNLLLLYIPLLLLIFSTSTLALFIRPISVRIRNNITTTTTTTNTKSSQESGFKTLYYPQTLDHFNYQPESYSTFKQKYVINSKYWGGAKSKSPILVYFGDEAALDNETLNGLILKDYGKRFEALLLYIEHRFYGESIPFGMSKKDVMKNEGIRGYFSSAQAIADYADVILHIKMKLNAHYSPVIIIGGSYGGMLASWFRLKYPHIALGALASSAPVLYFDNIISPNHGFYSVVTKDFKDTSEYCYAIIRDSWDEIDKMGQMPNGLSLLSEKFKTCGHLNNTNELKDFLQHVYSYVAQYNDPSLRSMCNVITNRSLGKDVLSRVHAGAMLYSVYTSNQANCLNTHWQNIYSPDTLLGWEWQICSEMVMPMVFGTSKYSMFPHQTFNLSKYIKNCKKKYNIIPRPHWITTHYGGHDMELILKTFGSNIIFSNGLKDPYSSEGVLHNLSDSIVAIHTTDGFHTVDLAQPVQGDPKWLVDQRDKEIETINGWINKYYANLEKLEIAS